MEIKLYAAYELITAFVQYFIDNEIMYNQDIQEKMSKFNEVRL